MLIRVRVPLDYRYLEQLGRDANMNEHALSGFQNIGSVELIYEVPDDPYKGVAKVVEVDGYVVSTTKSQR